MKRKQEEKPKNVVLKPVFGMKPGLYLTILYSIIILVILFFLLLFPGISHYGSKVTISSTPSGAAVFCDDIYIGSDSFTAFISAGTHQFRFQKPGFKELSLTKSIGGQRFFSLFFPKKDVVTTKLELESLETYLSWNLEQLYPWSFITEFNKHYFYPNFFTRIAEDLTAAPLSEEQADQVESFFIESAALIGSPEIFEDYSAGLKQLSSSYALSASSEILDRITSFYTDSNSLELPELPAAPAMESYHTDEVYDLLDIRFVSLPGGLAVKGNRAYRTGDSLTEFPETGKTATIAVALREITEKDYARFIEENPFWAPENRKTLVSEVLVDSQYLKGIDLEDPTDLPIRNISWFAAEAYCSWLTGKLDTSYGNLEVRLPTSLEWQYSAEASSESDRMIKVLQAASAYTSVPVNFQGNLWEMTADAFFTAGTSSLNELYPNQYMDRILRGESWNSVDSASLYTIGSLAPESCSEFVGFRPVMAER